MTYNRIFKGQQYRFWFVYPVFTVKNLLKKFSFYSLLLKRNLKSFILLLTYSGCALLAGSEWLQAQRQNCPVTFGATLWSPAGPTTTLSVSWSFPRAGVTCVAPLKVLWSRDYPKLGDYWLGFWSSLDAGSVRKANVSVLNQFFIAQRDPWSRKYSQQIIYLCVIMPKQISRQEMPKWNLQHS